MTVGYIGALQPDNSELIEGGEPSAEPLKLQRRPQIGYGKKGNLGAEGWARSPGGECTMLKDPKQSRYITDE